MPENDNSFVLRPFNRGITDAELLDDLRRVANDLSADYVSYDEYAKRGRCRSRVFETRFGSWNEALRQAGLSVRHVTNRPIEDYFENLREVWERLGRQPRREELKKPLSRISGSAYEKRFQGWRAALESFIGWVNETPGTEASIMVQSSEVTRSTPRCPSMRLRFYILQRDHFRCCTCGRSPAVDSGVILHVDHVKPWSSGGQTVAENLRTLCSSCNYGKSDTELEATS
jgi:hypothetical protein